MRLPRALRESGLQEVAPLSLSRAEGEEPWRVPIEPIIEIRGGNKITRSFAQRAQQDEAATRNTGRQTTFR